LSAQQGCGRNFVAGIEISLTAWPKTPHTPSFQDDAFLMYNRGKIRNFTKEQSMQTEQPESVGFSANRLERIGRAMQKYVDQNLMAGVIVLVARRGQVVYMKKFGWQEIAANLPMSFDTLFRIYSMTKPITSTAVMMLFEEGKIRLSDPLSRYVPAFKNPKVMQARNGCDFELVPARREITVHDLLTHTAGLSYGFDENSALDERYRKEFWEPSDKEPGLSLEEMVTALAKLPLASHPGTIFRYSVAIDVLGYLVQLVADQPFDAFLKEKIFDPLGMVDTDFWVPPEKASRLSAVYGPGDDGGLKVVEAPQGSRYNRPPSWPSGGGGLVSTIGDYSRFGQMLLNLGTLDVVRLLGRSTVAWMLENHLPNGVRQDADQMGANGFGLGGYVLLQPGLTHRPGSAGKFGWGGAANTEWWIDPTEQLQCILMTQYMPPFDIPIVDDFAQTVYQALD
jgi:CubicO group peptidase (beta-lactamase class C family)